MERSLINAHPGCLVTLSSHAGAVNQRRGSGLPETRASNASRGELILFHDSLFTFRRAVAKRSLVSILSSVKRKVKIQLSVERTATRVVSPRRSSQATCLIDQRKRHIEVR
jgi:hypothetical protein